MFSKTKRFSESQQSFEFLNKKKISLPPASQRFSKSPQRETLSVSFQQDILQQRESKRSNKNKQPSSPYSQELSKSPTLKSSCKRVNEVDFEAKYSTSKNRISVNSVKFNTNSSLVNATKDISKIDDIVDQEKQHRYSSGQCLKYSTQCDNACLMINENLEMNKGNIILDQSQNENKNHQKCEKRIEEKQGEKKSLTRLSQNRKNETSLDNPFNTLTNSDLFQNKENIFCEQEEEEENSSIHQNQNEISKHNKTLKKFKDLRYQQKFQRQSFLDQSQDQDQLYQNLIESLGQHENQPAKDLKSIFDKEKLEIRKQDHQNDQIENLDKLKSNQDIFKIEGVISIEDIQNQEKKAELKNKNDDEFQNLSICMKQQQNELKLPNTIFFNQNPFQNQEKKEEKSLKENEIMLSQKVTEQKNRILTLEELIEKKDQKIQCLEKEIFQLKTYYEFKDKHQQNYLNNILTNYLQLQADHENLRLQYEKDIQTKQENLIKQQEQEQQLKLIQELKRQILESEKIVEQQHEQIIQFRGNLRIFCRIKPVLGGYETDLKYREQVQNQLTIQINQRHKQVIEIKQDENAKFFFDSVFDMNSTQEDVFNQTQPFIQCALNGDQIAIIAYGQTGSGKTYTMEGVYDKENITINNQSGILPRTAAYLFKEKERVHIHRNLVFSVGVIEVYCEELRDLLQSDEKIQQKLDIIQLNKRIKVVNQVFQVVKNAEELLSVIKRSSMNRVTDKTTQNNRSSRSHCIYQIKIFENDQEKGGINIVDLAGSESFYATSNKRESLTTLKRIITMLSDRQFLVQSKIPYRESKLTRLLQDSLGGNSKTLVFVTVCPLEENFVQTKESLKFISKATF